MFGRGPTTLEHHEIEERTLGVGLIKGAELWDGGGHVGKNANGLFMGRRGVKFASYERTRGEFRSNVKNEIEKLPKAQDVRRTTGEVRFERGFDDLDWDETLAHGGGVFHKFTVPMQFPDITPADARLQGYVQLKTVRRK